MSICHVDAHCHILEKEKLERARAAGIFHAVQGGISPENWERQLLLAEECPGAITVCVGLHPWWIDESTDAQCAEAIALLPRYLKSAGAVGELGLDFGPRTSEQSHRRQERIFREQLELACAEKLPLVLHIVRAHEPAQRVLAEYSGRLPGGIVHGFTGSGEVARRYIELGLTISLGGSLVRKGFETLKRGVLSLPLEKIVIESDSPGQFDGPEGILDVAEALSGIRKLPAEELLEQSRRNLQSIFRIPDLDRI